MKKLEHDLLTENHTKVYYSEHFINYAPNHFIVTTDTPTGSEDVLAEVYFQDGPIKKSGVNGVMNEDLIAMVITRLEYFNQSEYRCRENSMAITKLEEALMWLGKRTKNREKRGIEGTYEK